MDTRKHFGAAVTDDPDDAPELLQAFFEDAELRHGDEVLRPYRGASIPDATGDSAQGTRILDADLLDRLRRTGPGWQDKLNNAVRAWLELVPPPTT